MSSRTPSQRGAALLTTMVSVAVLTAVAVDLAYTSQVSLQIAANARDELRASYQARSGVAISRLVLSFQQTLDAALPRPGGNSPVQIPRFQLWSLVPVTSELAAALFPAERAAGGPPSSFDARIEDEARKVNAQIDGSNAGGDYKLWLQVQSLYQLVCDARYDALFDREDDRGVRSTREDLLVRLRDWGDLKSQTSELAIRAGSSAPCSMVPNQPPFAEAFGDENQPYDRGEPRYRAKNARMDSLDELYLVAGVSDAFMAAFGDALTVYVPRDTKQTPPNPLDKKELVQAARRIADPPTQAALYTEEFADKLLDTMLRASSLGMVTVGWREFAEVVKGLQVQVNGTVLASSAQATPFGDQSIAFRIRSSGTSGPVKASIDAVVWMETVQPNTPMAAPGRLVYWREE